MKQLFSPENDKKGQVFNNIQALFVSLAAIIIVSAVTFLVLAQGQDQVVQIQGINEANPLTWTAAYNATRDLTDATAQVPTWIPLIVLVIIGGIIIMAVRLIRR